MFDYKTLRCLPSDYTRFVTKKPPRIEVLGGRNCLIDVQSSITFTSINDSANLICAKIMDCCHSIADKIYVVSVIVEMH